jgi:hypothetical protein
MKLLFTAYNLNQVKGVYVAGFPNSVTEATQAIINISIKEKLWKNLILLLYKEVKIVENVLYLNFSFNKL